MSMIYQTPGVYVHEVAGAHQMQAVGTSVPGFVGVAPKADAFVNQAIALNNWTQFSGRFVPEQGAVSTALSHAVYGFFLNGGQRCFVVNIGADGVLTGGTRRQGLDVLREVDEVAILAAPGYTSASAYESVIAQCEQLQDRVAILDLPEEVDDLTSLTRVATEGSPEPSSRGPRGRAAETAAGSESGGGAGEVGEGQPAVGMLPAPSSHATAYWPWVKVRDPFSGEIVSAPPSGHIAGVWARSDATRGVHKAPANELIRGAVNLCYRLTDAEQAELNSAGVNANRAFTGEGIRVWGARTLDPNDEFRYVNARRLLTNVKETIVKSTRWIVFEPNAHDLWKMMASDLIAYFTRLWRDGALLGRTPEESFFVKCDEETNPPDTREAGQVRCEIGLAIVKPAEFVIFRISMFAGGSDIQEQGVARV